ncbi:MAG TPA: hypothetical protein PL167_07545 [Cyclobacteriaceae bacterium]|nr:hypothetical protein [Cyclobacteriaceae bacterium]
MIKIKINGKPHELPEKWEEVDFKTFVKLVKADQDYVSILSILLGIETNELRKAKIQGLDLIISRLNFMTKQPEIDPKPIKLGTFEFPKDIAYETVEQFEDTRREIAKVQDQDLTTQTEAMAVYAAIYCQKPYDSEQAQYLSKSFYSLPCTEVMAAGSFFQAKCLSMQSGLSMNYLRKNIRLKKNRPVFASWAKRSVFTPLLTGLLVMWERMTKKF